MQWLINQPEDWIERAEPGELLENLENWRQPSRIYKSMRHT